jgi:hypothetical protein
LPGRNSTHVPRSRQAAISLTTAFCASAKIQGWAEVPAVDYVAHQVQLLSLVMAKKIEQQFGLKSRRTEVKI